MILRKPYAILIKNFRLIHGILSFLLIFISYQTNEIHSFFSEYIINSNNLKIYIEPSITLIDKSLYLAVFLSIAVFSIIFILMRKKEKPIKYYVFSIIFYVLFMFLLLLAGTQIFSILQNKAELQSLRIVRDLLWLFNFFQYVFIFVSIIRTIGFNIKSFDFQNDLKEISILEEDNEEFVLDIELDSNDVKTKMRRHIRLFKYFIKENKTFIIISICICIFFLITYAVLDFTVYNKIYKENDVFKHNQLNIKVLDSFETTDNYSYEDISEDKYMYYIILMEVSNNTNMNLSINMSDIELEVSNVKSYSPTTELYEEFKDIGEGYKDNKILSNTKNRYIFVFKIDKEYSANKKILNFIKNINITTSKQQFVYTKVRIEPSKSNKVDVLAESKIGDSISIDDNLIGKFSLKIDEFDIVDKVELEYKEKINGKEYSFVKIIQPSYKDYYGKKIMKLKATIGFEKELNKNMTNKLLGNFARIRYIKDNKEYINPFDVTEKTPENELQYKYLEVYENIVDADQIYLDIVIRNHKYIYKLK